MNSFLASKHASLVANNRIVFNIKGNRHRLVVVVVYQHGVVYIPGLLQSLKVLLFPTPNPAPRWGLRRIWGVGG